MNKSELESDFLATFEQTNKEFDSGSASLSMYMKTHKIE